MAILPGTTAVAAGGRETRVAVLEGRLQPARVSSGSPAVSRCKRSWPRRRLGMRPVPS